MASSQRQIPGVIVGKADKRGTYEYKSVRIGLGLNGIQQVSVGHPSRKGVEGDDSGTQEG